MCWLAKPKFFSQACRRYGDVLINLPELQDVSIEETLRTVLRWFKEEPVLWRLCCAVPNFLKVSYGILDKCQEKTGPWPGPIQRCLQYLCQEGRFHELPNLCAYISRQQSRKEEVYLTTALKWSVEQRAAVQDFFQESYKTQVQLHWSHDPHLMLGGVVIWRGVMLDLSLESVFRHIEQKGV